MISNWLSLFATVEVSGIFKGMLSSVGIEEVHPLKRIGNNIRMLIIFKEGLIRIMVSPILLTKLPQGIGDRVGSSISQSGSTR
jgi:hypothetical protein